MAMFNFICVLIVATRFNVAITAEDIAEDYQEQNNIERPVGRSYSITTCDYGSQIGYTCLACNRALHCYPGNIAILVDCYGPFRFCRDGRCSRYQGEKCFSDNKQTTPKPVLIATIPVTDITANSDTTANAATTNIAATNVATANSDATTKNIAENVTETVTEAVSLPDDPKATTKSDVRSISVDSNVV